MSLTEADDDSGTIWVISMDEAREFDLEKLADSFDIDLERAREAKDEILATVEDGAS